MSRSSDDESSDSSCEFLVSPDKINLDSKFFAKPAPKSNLKTVRNDSSDESDDFDDQNDVSSAELLAQVLKNLEKANEQYSFGNDNKNNVAGTTESSCEKNNKIGPAAGKSENLSNEINDLLLQGESGAIASTSFKAEVKEENEDEEESREVQEEYSIPKEGVKITLPGENLLFMKKKKKGLDLQTVLKNRLNQQLRAHQVFIHKVGLLCWLGHGFHLNKQINDPEVLATALSLVTSSSYPKGRVDLVYLEKITKWFRKVISMNDGGEDEVVTKESLKEALKKKTARNYRELVLLYVATLRALGLNCRLVISLRPPALKLHRDQLFNPSESKEKKAKVNLNIKSEKESKKKPAGRNKRIKLSDEKTGSEKIASENSSTARKQANEEAKKKAATILKQKPIKRTVTMRNSAAEPGRSVSEKSKKLEESHNIDEDNGASPEKMMRLRSKTLAGKLATIVANKGKTDDAKAANKARDAKNNDEALKDNENNANKSLRLRSKRPREFISDEVDEPLDGKRTTRLSGKSKTTKTAKTSKDNVRQPKKSLNRGSKASTSVPDSDYSEYEFEAEMRSDSETEPESESESEAELKPSSKRKSNAGKKRCLSRAKRTNIKDRRLLSSDDEDKANASGKVRKTQDIWVEVYVESEENWISVSVPDDKIHCISEIYKKAASPVLYVIAWNSAGSLRDVTRRYCPQWLTVTRKQRVDEKWWNESLTPWKENETALTKAEDEMLLQRELEQPLPKTVGECKGHPLYALTRHLLKYEALYPPDAKPLGFLKTGEAVYSRHCVHTLCSRETWVKNARVVKPGEQCYKVVKAMPKFDRLSGVKLKDQPLELFGKWQTGPFVPPEAKNGIVPRNEYGNVDLFKQCMLPKGTVHITLPALNRVARKLNIDCAPAVVGFNFGGRGALPAFEGFVVCEEFEDTLREAWEVEQVEAAKRARERVEKRVYGNWRKLIKGLLIRERLAAKYEFKDEEEEPNVSKKPPKPNKAGGTGKKTRGKRGK